MNLPDISVFQHVVKTDLPLDELIRYLRVVPEKYQRMIVGHGNGVLGLRAEPEELKEFIKMWDELVPH